MKQDRWTVIPAVYILLQKDDKILLLHRSDNSYYAGGLYSLPSGHLEGGESVIQAAVRETREEIGVDIQQDNLKMVHVIHRVATEGDHERIDFFFSADKWSGEVVNAEPDKCQGLEWAKPTELPDKMVPEVRFAIEQILEGKLYSDYNFS